MSKFILFLAKYFKEVSRNKIIRFQTLKHPCLVSLNKHLIMKPNFHALFPQTLFKKVWWISNKFWPKLLRKIGILDGTLMLNSETLRSQWPLSKTSVVHSKRKTTFSKNSSLDPPRSLVFPFPSRRALVTQLFVRLNPFH